jgi:hypothetical protein
MPLACKTMSNTRKLHHLTLLATLCLLALLLYLGYVPADPGWARALLGPLPGHAKLSWLNVLGYVLALSVFPLAVALAFRAFPSLKKVQGSLLAAICLVVSLVLVPPAAPVGNPGVGILFYPSIFILFVLGLASSFRSRVSKDLPILKSPLFVTVVALVIAAIRVFVFERVVLSDYIGLGVFLVPLSVPVFAALWIAWTTSGETAFRGFLSATGAWLLARAFTPLHLYSGDLGGRFGREMEIWMSTLLFQTGIIVLFAFYETYLEQRGGEPRALWQPVLWLMLLTPLVIVLLNSPRPLSGW